MTRLSLLAIAISSAAAYAVVACGETLAPAQDTPSADASTNDANASPDGAPIDAGGDATGCTPTCAETLATLGAPLKRIVVRGDTIYVVRGVTPEARLFRIRAPFPATPEPIAPNEAVFGNVVADAQGVYWGALDGLRTLPHDAPATGVQPLAEGEVKISGLTFAPGSSSLWFTVFDQGASGGKIAACAVPGCTGKGWSNADYASDIAFTTGVGAARVDMAWPTPTAAAPAVLVNGAALNDAGALNLPTWFASDGPSVFVAANEGLFRVTPTPGGGGSVEKIFGPSSDRIHAVTTDGTARVVFAQNDTLQTCAVNGAMCAPKPIVALRDDIILDVTIADGFYYWVTESGRVQRLPRE